MTKKKKSANNGNKEREKSTICKGTQLSEESQNFLKKMNAIWGELVSSFTEERLKTISKEKQSDIILHILHYMYHDEILPTGDIDVDIKTSEVIEKIPLLSVLAFQILSQKHITTMKIQSDITKLAC